jgi:hypothetical protein
MKTTTQQETGGKQSWSDSLEVGVPLTFIFIGLISVLMILVAAIMGWW